VKTFIADSGRGEPISLRAALTAGKKVAPDATKLLAEDHRLVLGWFAWYEQSRDAPTRAVLARRICAALLAHMAAEEKWLYPAARATPRGADLVSRAYDEHAAAKALMTEIDAQAGQSDQGARMLALKEEIVSHVTEEELELFPALEASDLDLYELGRSVAVERSEQLFKNLRNTPEPANTAEEASDMPIAQEQARELFVAGLKNAHATARNGATMLQTQVRRLRQYPRLKEKLEASLRDKEKQLTRLETLLESHGETRSALKDAVLSAGAGIAGLATAGADDEIIKNSLATLAHAKFAAAAYETLILFGEACGETPQRLRPLQQSLSEERGLATFVEENLRPTGLRFMQLRSERNQASH
jgi:ferritin-like metal-binding protein YciE